MKTSLTLLMNIINCSNRLFGVEKAPLLISSATAIYLGIPVLHEVFKIFRAEILQESALFFVKPLSFRLQNFNESRGIILCLHITETNFF